MEKNNNKRLDLLKSVDIINKIAKIEHDSISLVGSNLLILFLNLGGIIYYERS